MCYKFSISWCFDSLNLDQTIPETKVHIHRAYEGEEQKCNSFTFVEVARLLCDRLGKHEQILVHQHSTGEKYQHIRKRAQIVAKEMIFRGFAIAL